MNQEFSDAGHRQRLLQARYEKLVKEIADEREKASATLEHKIKGDRFVPQQLDIEAELKRDTVGLVQLDEFQRIRDNLENRKRKEEASERKSAAKKKQIDRVKLSFGDDDEADFADSIVVKKKLKKDPTVDTSFLPDTEREEHELKERERLRRSWLERQLAIKNEEFTLDFEFISDATRRGTVTLKKGDTVAAFLTKCREQIPRIRTTAVDNLMLVKCDVVLPHNNTFYDFIVNKARGKSGILFDPDTQNDPLLLGKVLERSWFDMNRHIFPMSYWETYDPHKDYEAYKRKERIDMK